MSRNRVATTSGNISTQLDAANLLLQQASASDDGCLEISNGSISWYFYLESGQLIYATHSVDPFDHLDSHLRRLSRKVPSITSEVRTQVRMNFAADSPASGMLRPDYQAISWLVLTKYLNASEAETLIKSLSKEILESYLLLKAGTFQFIPKTNDLPVFCKFDIEALLPDCQERLQFWQALGPEIWSPYQRPYLSNQQALEQNQGQGQIQKLQKILRGFSFRHLGVLLNIDELQLAQSLHPLISNKTVQLRDPNPPFDQLLTFRSNASEKAENKASNGHHAQPKADLKALENVSVSQKHHTIACVDDSPAILNTINRYLQDQNISVVMIDDPVKALVQIMRAKPELILLDVGMPWVDGYELCRLLRKNSRFKKVPIVMVTGNTGLIDRAKAKVSGATDYMTKPFTQDDLLKMVFRHLT